MPSPLTARHRTEQLALRAVTLKDLRRIWGALDPKRLDDTYPAWERAAVALVMSRRSMSQQMASRYVQRLRAVARVPGALPDIEASVLDEERLRSSLRVTSVVSIKVAMTRGVALPRAVDTAFVANAGAVSRHVIDAGRDVVVAAATKDRYARGWQRVTSAGACDFCQMLAGRGEVYSEASADFQSHDHCACFAEPVYR